MTKQYINWVRDIFPEIKKTLEFYVSQQIPLTLRGVFYILVSLNVLQNLPTRYDYLSTKTARWREDGYLPIYCFVDGGRYITDINDKYRTVNKYLQIGVDHIRNSPTGYKERFPRWYRQPHYVEVWVEKATMRGILHSIINTTGGREVRIVPTGGQESVTFAWDNVKRLRQKQREGKQIHIRYFGDLDPSGEAIELEIYNKLWLPPYSLPNVDFKRVAVTNE